MSPTVKQMLLGIGKTAATTISATITGMPAVDPDHFGIQTAHGWLHMTEFILWITFVAELRYLKQWFDLIAGNGHGTTPPPPPIVQ